MLSLWCFLDVVILVLSLAGKALSRSARRWSELASGILGMVATNDVYPPLLDSLGSLDGDLGKLGEELHADMGGYLDYYKEESING